MFIPFNEIQAINTDAHNDLWDFFLDLFDLPVFRGEIESAHKEAAKHDKAFGDAIGAVFEDFTEPFLYWLEEREKDAKPPWEVREGDNLRQPMLPSDSKCRKFLLSLLDRLERLVEPSDEDGLKIAKFGYRPSVLLEKFGQSTALNRLGCILSYNDCRLEWEKYTGFASWLIVFKDSENNDSGLKGDIHIVSNIDRIRGSSSETDNQARRFEKVYLHELGHATTNLQYYFDASPVDGVVTSRPEHETRAWIYACAIQAYVSSARARISRLLRKGDNEWK